MRLCSDFRRQFEKKTVYYKGYGKNAYKGKNSPCNAVLAVFPLVMVLCMVFFVGIVAHVGFEPTLRYNY